MKIPLNEFEQIIDETILKRGLTYFKNGFVTDFSEISNGEYEASVSGTEEYTVQLVVKKGIIEEHVCDCPYDMGPVCKHVVAVIFYLQQDALDFTQPISPKPKKKKIKSVAQQIKELLQTISHKELMAFVQENSKKDKKFRNYFLASFGHLNQDQSKEFLKKQIHSILQAAAGRNGWIGWSEMKYVVNTIKPFVENAEKNLLDNNFENVFFMGTALLEEMFKALEYTDDSKGDIGYYVETSLWLLTQLSKAELPKKLKDELFEYCIETFKTGHFSGWDWHFEIIQIAIELIETEKEVETTLACLENVQGKYEKEQAQSLKLDLLRKHRDEKEVDDFVNKHISNSSIRKDEIEKAFEKKNFERAITLCKDGIENDEKESPGLAKAWYDWLLKIAQAQNDTPKIIEYARYRLIDSFGGTQDYYQILKNNIEAKDWHPFLEEIIKETVPDTTWRHNELIRTIYIKEEWWDRLFQMLQQNTSLDNIEKNEGYLSKDYSPELIELYSQRILKYVEDNLGRNCYQTACRYLRRMKKLGGNSKVEKLIEIFRNTYPKRKALMEELNRF